MSCRHDGQLAARWDYLTHDDTSGTGWIVCASCYALLQRMSVIGGRFRSQGRYLANFEEQVAARGALVGLRELEVD